MSTNTCLTGPPFSISGGPYFPDSSVRFQVSIDSPEAELISQEWYLNDLLIADQRSATLSTKASPGIHTVGARILTTDGWSGVRHLQFNNAPVSLQIVGQGRITPGQAALYRVIAIYPDGINQDFTGDYIFTSSQGQFAGNTLMVNSATGEDISIKAVHKLGGTLSLTVSAEKLFYNKEKTQYYRKNDCAPLFTGSYITYTVPAGTYSSAISQADADAKALADISANGQDYANRTGNCKPPYCDVSLQYYGDRQATTLYKILVFDNEQLIQEFDTSTFGSGGYFSSSVSFDFPTTHRLKVLAYAINQHNPTEILQLKITRDNVTAFDQPLVRTSESFPLEWSEIVSLDTKVYRIENRMTFGNEQTVRSFIKNDCQAGYMAGSTVEYQVDANKYFADTKYGANSMALSEIWREGQEYANRVGVCAAPVNIAFSYQGESQALAKHRVVVYDNDQEQVNTGSGSSAQIRNFGSLSGRTLKIRAYKTDTEDQTTNLKLTIKRDNVLVLEQKVDQRSVNNPLEWSVMMPAGTDNYIIRAEGILEKVQFGNQFITRSFTKNDCPPVYQGRTLDYPVEDNTFFADTQAKADQLALDYIMQNGQSYVNEAGSCTPLS